MLLCLIVASVVAGPPAGVLEDSLSPQCQTPRCPTAKVKSDSPITLPYPLDCFQYIICEESGPRTVACPEDLIFNKVRSPAKAYPKRIWKRKYISLRRNKYTDTSNFIHRLCWKQIFEIFCTLKRNSQDSSYSLRDLSFEMKLPRYSVLCRDFKLSLGNKSHSWFQEWLV